MVYIVSLRTIRSTGEVVRKKGRSTESPGPFTSYNNDILDDRSHQNHQDHAISVAPLAAPGTSQKCERTWRRVIRDSLITLSWDSVSPRARTLRAFSCFSFSISMSTMSVVASERLLLGHVPEGNWTTPPRTTEASRIEMRLLRDTRRVLEYLSKKNVGVWGVTTRRR
jgi:hypothetical protein